MSILYCYYHGEYDERPLWRCRISLAGQDRTERQVYPEYFVRFTQPEVVIDESRTAEPVKEKGNWEIPVSFTMEASATRIGYPIYEDAENIHGVNYWQICRYKGSL
ncbi:hypothetical protein [Chitinophaga pinensis]|uniref:Uncharacterized protein n=1 Tax=Chitinophaga pinensis TaxID=79329 RepID=A0A5C6LLR0_9BACT|nr:hypothetical protein [Chitinophaga pinensis]TWV95693.1 hypothetical protein FEF09_23965 [Chitinophaga pinensis]